MDDVRYLPEAEAISKEFPGWDAWVGLRTQVWHGQLRTDALLVLLHDESAAGLRQKIGQWTKENS